MSIIEKYPLGNYPSGGVLDFRSSWSSLLSQKMAVACTLPPVRFRNDILKHVQNGIGKRNSLPSFLAACLTELLLKQKIFRLESPKCCKSCGIQAKLDRWSVELTPEPFNCASVASDCQERLWS